jgi:hypothetical protein
MLKSVYGYLFADRDQEKRPVPTIDQVFSGIDVKKTPEIVPQIENEPVSHQPPQPPQPSQQTKETTLVCSATEKRWVKDISPVTEVTTVAPKPGVEVMKATVIETIKVQEPEPELALTKPVQTFDEFRKEMTEHITIQRQKHQEKLHQKELEKLERPKRTLRQWVPNDELARAHDKAAEAVGKVPNLLKKIKQHQEKITTKQNEVERIQNKKDLNPYDRFELIDYKKDIMAEQGKISVIELELEQAQKYIDDPIFEEFALYLAEAEQYIKDAELTGIMNVNDILTSESIYIKTKSLMDSLKYGKKNQNSILMERLHFISQNFNMPEVHENSRGKNLREFADFFIGDKINNPLYLFDKMDAQAIGDSATMRSITGGEAGGMIDQSLIDGGVQEGTAEITTEITTNSVETSAF